MFRKISSAAAYAHSHSFSSPPFTRPPKPTPFNSRNSLTSLLHSFSSPFTRPSKPTPITCRNSTSLLRMLMFRNISFLASPKPTPLNSRNSTSLFPHAESCQDGVSTARLQKLLQPDPDCKSSSDVSADEAFRYMVQMEPRFGLNLFNLFLNALGKNKRYHDQVLSLFGKLSSGGLTPSVVTLNILLDCCCKANRISDAFLVMGRILRMGYSPTIATFNSLIKGLCTGSRVDDAVQLYLTMKKFGCRRPNVTSWRNLELGLRLCGLGDASNALKFHEENVVGNGQYSSSLGCKPKPKPKPDHVSRCCMSIDRLCKRGREGDALKIFLEMRGRGGRFDVRVYNSLVNGLCCAGKREVAVLLLQDMVGQKIPFDGKTFYGVIDIFCQIGYMYHIKDLLNWMIAHGIHLRSYPLIIFEGRRDRS